MSKEKIESRKERSQKGQALVEFALIVPIMLLLLLVPIDLYRVINTKMILNSAASESLAKLNYEDISASGLEGRIKLLIEKDFGDKLADSKVRITELKENPLEASDYTYYVYSSELAEENPDDFQMQFEDRESNYHYKEVELQLAYEVNPISVWGSLFIGDSFEVKTPIYRKNVYMSGYTP